MVMATSIDAAGDIEPDLSDFIAQARIGKMLENPVCERQGSGVGKIAVIKPRTDNHVTCKTVFTTIQTNISQSFKNPDQLVTAHVRDDDILRIGETDFSHTIAIGKIGNTLHL